MQKSTRHISKKLYVHLDSVEREQKIAAMLNAMQSLEETENKIQALKDSAKAHNVTVEYLKEQIAGDRMAIKHGKLVDVPVKILFDWQDRRVTVIRKDTWEIIEERDMTENDKPELTDDIEEPVQEKAK